MLLALNQENTSNFINNQIFRQNKLLKVALEKNNEQVHEISQIVNDQTHSKCQIDMFNDFRLDNEVNKIITQVSPARNINFNKHQSSALQQESTDIATDENTARVTVKPLGMTPQKLHENGSREVILTTNTIPEISTQNDDLRVVQESSNSVS